MEFRLLEYFLAVAREQNITAAAESLHISQPALSTQLKALETELGKQLLIRVIDISPSCRNGDLARPLIEGAGVEIVLPDDLDIEKACKKKAKKKGYRHRHGK